MLQSQAVVKIADPVALPQHKTDAEHTIKVTVTSKITADADAIVGVIREHRFAEVQAIGAAAVDQAIKVVAVAASYLKDEGIHIIYMPCFSQIIIDDEECTALRFLMTVLE